MNKLLAATAAAILLAPVANATTINEVRFYTVNDDEHGVAAPDSAPLLTPTTAPNTGTCAGGDYCGTSLTYAGGVLGGTSIVATATGPAGGAAEVIQDFAPSDGGLGANGGTSSDNIGIGESVTLTFSQEVRLTGFYGYIDHTRPAVGTADSFTINGIAYSFNFNDWTNVNLYGTTFVFRFVDADQQPSAGMYVSAIRYEVPEPTTLALLGLGLAGIGFGARRRKA